MRYITGLINLIISLVVSTIIIYAINFIAGFAGADYSFTNGEVFVMCDAKQFWSPSEKVDIFGPPGHRPKASRMYVQNVTKQRVHKIYNLTLF